MRGEVLADLGAGSGFSDRPPFELGLEVLIPESQFGCVVLQLDACDPVDNVRQLVVANARTDAS